MSKREPIPHSQRPLIKDLPAEKQEEARKERNAESARRSRRKKREEEAHLRRLYTENEHRIAHLERTVEALSSELDGGSTSMRNLGDHMRPSFHSVRDRAGSSACLRLKDRASGMKGGRPEWFGEPFWSEGAM